MIKDFNEFHDEACITADVCIVGAGAAGITIAREFLSTRYTVVVLESGGLDTEAETQQLYQSEIVGLPHIGIHQGRVRTFGGTTTVWGGQSLRFGASDFQERSWIPDSGWPICRQKLDPYYDRADRYFNSARASLTTIFARRPALNLQPLIQRSFLWNVHSGVADPISERRIVAS